MRLWLIPTIYAIASMIGGVAVPRLEHEYFRSHTLYNLGLSASSAQAYLSAAASGMMALTGIVFSIAFVMVQFSAIAYSPRLVIWLARDRILFHSLGIFTATFVYALSTLAWIDRNGTGAVPPLSCLIVAAMLMMSVILFARLVQRLTDLQITNVLHMIGDKGRDVIGEVSQMLDWRLVVEPKPIEPLSARTRLGPVTQILRYTGKPRSIVRFDIDALQRQASEVDATIVMRCAVGDTVVDDASLLCVHGGKDRLPERALRRAIELGAARTFEQDPKYAIRLLVDIAIRALSPAINDPTTAVQAIDQIEDLLRRLGRHALDTGYVADASGVPRVIVPMPTWEDYLTLAFDEIRQFGAGSIQVMRRMRSALVAVADSLVSAGRIDAVKQYLKHLDDAIELSAFDAEDRAMARREDRQGLGLSRDRDGPGAFNPSAPMDSEPQEFGYRRRGAG